MAAPDPVLRLAVVGHTNTGKTSLLRTLTRNPRFGDVQDNPGTTRHVEGARLLVDGKAVVELFDTPGMEDGMALLDYLDQLARPGERPDGPERIRRFLDSPESRRRFEQEARVLRKLLDCDAGLYVVDVRDPVLAKHKDELVILAGCGHPLLPVLNFTHSPQARTDTWRAALARAGLHATVEFDTIAPALDGEAQLYDKLALLLDAHAGTLQSLKRDIDRQRALRQRDAARLIAELLIDTAACRMSAAEDEAGESPASQARSEPPGIEESAHDRAIAALRDAVRRREQACVRALLERYNFRPADFPSHTLPLQGERWGMDLFHPAAMKDMGIQLGKGMVAGAMAGATLDAFTAGLSLGAATLIGAAAGGLWQGADKWGKRLAGRLRGHQELTVDDGVLRLLALRQLALVEALERRGHAAQAPILLTDAEGAETQAWRRDALPPELGEARSQPQWSTLTSDHVASPRRDAVAKSLAGRLAASLAETMARPSA